MLNPGVGAMELVAMDMKRRGVYLARQLSFEGCSFELDEVPLDNRFVEMYDKCVELWNDAKDYFLRAALLMGDDFKMPGMWQQFWAAHQRFFKYLCMSAKGESTKLYSVHTGGVRLTRTMENVEKPYELAESCEPRYLTKLIFLSRILDYTVRGSIKKPLFK